MGLKFLPFPVICICMLLTIGCNRHKAPSTDVEDNHFYSIYRDIYRNYNKIPLDSTNRQLRDYLAEFPENSDAWAFYGYTWFRLDSDAQAVMAYRRAIAGDDQKAAYYAGLGTAFNVQNKLDSAEECLLKALALRDSSPYTTLNLSMLYLKRNDREGSLAFADSTFLRDRSSPLILAGLSFVYFALNQPEQGTEKYSLAVKNGLKDTTSFKDVLNGKMKIENYYRLNSY